MRLYKETEINIPTLFWMCFYISIVYCNTFLKLFTTAHSDDGYYTKRLNSYPQNSSCLSPIIRCLH